MGFSVGAYAKIWEIKEVKDKYTTAIISVSKKDKDTGMFTTVFKNYVTFVGNAHLQVPKENQRIKIKGCDVTNTMYVNKDGVKSYPVHFVIYDYELENGYAKGQAREARTMTEMAQASDDDLPF